MKRNRAKTVLLLVAGLSGLMAAVAGLSFSATGLKGVQAQRQEGSPAPTLSALVALPPESLRAVGIARMNLLCQQGLFQSEGLDINRALNLIEQMGARLKSETQRHLYRFERNSGEFENSEGFFRMVMMGVVLTEDFGIHYNPRQRTAPAETGPDDGFFADPQMVFLGGLLGPGRQGTCSSLPVLYVAVGRQLGYPLKLVTTKGHLFVRWEGGGERFNIEATGRGVNRFEDDYYRHWPFGISAAEEAAEGYLKSLSPAEELAVFLSIRGMCLRESGRLAEAAESFATTSRLSPGTRSYQQMADALGLKHGTGRLSTGDNAASIQRDASHSKL
jgi:hypothetical protein